MTPEQFIEEKVKEFERKSNNAEWSRHKETTGDTFFFEEGEGLAYDQESAGK